MTVTPKRLTPELSVLGGVIALVLVTLMAIRMAGTPSQARPQLASQKTVGASTEKSTPRPRERVRYQATIDNWRRYRDLTKSD